MVIDVRIEWDAKVSLTIEEVRNAIHRIYNPDVFTVTPLPQVSEDYKQTLRDIGNILSKSTTSYIPTLTLFELEAIISGASCLIQKALNDLNSQSINREKEERKWVVIDDGSKFKPTPQFPQLLDMNISTPFAAPDMVARETINQIITYLQQKEGQGR